MGPGSPQARRAGAGRARPGGRRPRTHITGRGPGPHPGSPGGDRRGAGRCRPTRSLPATRGSPWRRRLADRLPALAPGPRGSVEVAAAAAARLVSAHSGRSSAADGGGGGASRPRLRGPPLPRPRPARGVTPRAAAGPGREPLPGPRAGPGFRRW